jgi:hypothetical protein
LRDGSRGVIGDAAVDPFDAVAGELGGGAEQEPRAGRALLVGQNLRVGELGVVIDEGVHVVVARSVEGEPHGRRYERLAEKTEVSLWRTTCDPAEAEIVGVGVPPN